MTMMMMMIKIVMIDHDDYIHTYIHTVRNVINS